MTWTIARQHPSPPCSACGGKPRPTTITVTTITVTICTPCLADAIGAHARESGQRHARGLVDVPWR